MHDTLIALLPHCREGDDIEHGPSSKRVSLGKEHPMRSANAAPCPGDAAHSEDASCSADARESNAAEASGGEGEAEEVLASSSLSTLTGGPLCAPTVPFLASWHALAVFKAFGTQITAAGAFLAPSLWLLV